MRGFSDGVSGFHLYTLNVLFLGAGSVVPSTVAYEREAIVGRNRGRVAARRRDVERREAMLAWAVYDGLD